MKRFSKASRLVIVRRRTVFVFAIWIHLFLLQALTPGAFAATLREVVRENCKNCCAITEEILQLARQDMAVEVTRSAQKRYAGLDALSIYTSRTRLHLDENGCPLGYVRDINQEDSPADTTDLYKYEKSARYVANLIGVGIEEATWKAYISFERGYLLLTCPRFLIHLS